TILSTRSPVLMVVLTTPVHAFKATARQAETMLNALARTALRIATRSSGVAAPGVLTAVTTREMARPARAQGQAVSRAAFGSALVAFSRTPIVEDSSA